MPFSHSTSRRIKLSRQELCVIARSINRDFSPRFLSGRSVRGGSIRFSSQELQEISRQIGREFAPNPADTGSKLVLLAISPRRLHAYWQLAKQRLSETFQAAESPLTLRVYTDRAGTVEVLPPKPDHDERDAQEGIGKPAPEPAQAPSAASEVMLSSSWIDIVVDSLQGRRDVVLPETAVSAAGYHAVLGHGGGEQGFVPLLDSNRVVTSVNPPQRPAAELSLAAAQSIMPLSKPSSPVGKTASAQGKNSSP